MVYRKQTDRRLLSQQLALGKQSDLVQLSNRGPRIFGTTGETPKHAFMIWIDCLLEQDYVIGVFKHQDHATCAYF